MNDEIHYYIVPSTRAAVRKRPTTSEVRFPLTYTARSVADFPHLQRPLAGLGWRTTGTFNHSAVEIQPDPSFFVIMKGTGSNDRALPAAPSRAECEFKYLP